MEKTNKKSAKKKKTFFDKRVFLRAISSFRVSESLIKICKINVWDFDELKVSRDARVEQGVVYFLPFISLWSHQEFRFHFFFLNFYEFDLQLDDLLLQVAFTVFNSRSSSFKVSFQSLWLACRWCFFLILATPGPIKAKILAYFGYSKWLLDCEIALE